MKPARSGRAAGRLSAKRKSPSVLLVDDAEIVRQGIARLLAKKLGPAVFGEAHDENSALRAIAGRSWDLIILSADPTGRGFEVLRKARRDGLETHILMLSARTHYLYAVRAFQLGATGYVGCNTSADDFGRAVTDVLTDKKYFQGFEVPPSAGDILPRLRQLSAREYCVLLALGEGKPPGVIAAELNLSNKTVSTYKRRVINKLGIKSTVELVRDVVVPNLS